MKRWTVWKERFERLGTIGMVVHMIGFGLCLCLMAAAVRYGFLTAVPWLAERLPTGATTLVGAYALTKVLSPARIGLTLVVTPAIARWVGRPVPVPPA